MIHGTNAPKASSEKDPLIVEEVSMTRLRAKKVKEAMRLLVQTMVDESSIMARKGTSFMLGLREEISWFNLIRAMDEGSKSHYVNHAVKFVGTRKKNEVRLLFKKKKTS